MIHQQCAHDGETGTYCTKCWMNLYEARQRGELPVLDPVPKAASIPRQARLRMLVLVLAIIGAIDLVALVRSVTRLSRDRADAIALATVPDAQQAVERRIAIARADAIFQGALLLVVAVALIISGAKYRLAHHGPPLESSDRPARGRICPKCGRSSLASDARCVFCRTPLDAPSIQT